MPGWARLPEEIIHCDLVMAATWRTGANCSPSPRLDAKSG
jgi:hypothetical protein